VDTTANLFEQLILIESVSNSLSVNFIVAVTGGIASGKSTVSRKFSALGIDVIDTDLLAREVVEPGHPVLTEVVKSFGNLILLPDGCLDREAMRRIVFADSAKRRVLEGILHPAIHDEVQRRMDTVSSPYCVLVIPLFAESSHYDWVDRVLVVDVPEEVQIRRVMERDDVTRGQAEAILTAQASRTQRLALADDVIENTGSIKELEDQVAELHLKYLEMARTRNK
jgi:dephospho-CoA kinase